MLKVFMNEPYATSHELAQAKRLVQLLEGYAVQRHMWLCLNFNLGGKAIDGALILKDCFVILELKAVSGDVDCGPSMENSPWTWRMDQDGISHEIRTPPYINPFSQIKNYRTAAIGEFELMQKGFLGNITLLKEPFKFAWWVKGCVLMSRRTAEDVKVTTGQLSHGTAKWFCCGALGDVVKAVDGLSHTVSLSEKEIERLITKVLGLKRVDSVIEAVDMQLTRDDGEGDQLSAETESSDGMALASFMRRYGNATAIKPPKVVKKVVKSADPVTNAVNDFSEIDALFNTEATSAASVRNDSADRNVLSADRPIERGYLKMTLKEEMESAIPGYGVMTEVEGAEAVDIVVRDFPQLSNFEVSKVFRFGDSISETDGERMVQYFSEKYSPTPPWSKLTYAQDGIDFVFGRAIDVSPLMEQGVHDDVPYERPIGTRFLMARWVNGLVEKEAEGLPPLSALEVQHTGNLSEDDIRRYAKTYFPRSCAEAFVVSDWLMGNDKTPHQVSILDVGCGCGGASLGCLLALHKHSVDGRSEVDITGVDVNAHALEFAKNLFEIARLQFKGHKLNFLATHGDMRDVLPRQSLYNVVVASKSIGEVALVHGPDAYVQVVRMCSERVMDRGVLILIDLPKHRSSMETSVDALAKEGFEGWLKTLSIALAGTSDNEEYICACLTKGSSKKIIKE